MPNHVRQQIREAAATALTGLATTGSRVFQSRVYAMQDADLPGLRIYTSEESAGQADIGSLLERNLQLVVEGCAKANADLDDTLDLIAKEVEIALAGAALVSSRKAFYQGAEIELSGEGEKVAGVIRMRFGFTYFTQAATPDVAA